MVTITGKISEIEIIRNPEKVIVTICDDYETVFVEFRGRRIVPAISYKVDQMVAIKIEFEGKKSTTGRKYNNLVGRSIYAVNDQQKEIG